jgi:putative phosphoribosyl transferase
MNPRTPASPSREVEIPIEKVVLHGTLTVPPAATGIVIFAHGSGSSRFSPRNQAVATELQQGGLATLLFDLLAAEEEAIDARTGHLRFDIDLLAERLAQATQWVSRQAELRDLTIGYFGASTGAAAALVAAARLPDLVSVVVSRGGRPDLAGMALPKGKAPTLLIVGGRDLPVIEMNREALAVLQVEKELEIVPGATHLFESRARWRRSPGSRGSGSRGFWCVPLPERLRGDGCRNTRRRQALRPTDLRSRSSAKPPGNEQMNQDQLKQVRRQLARERERAVRSLARLTNGARGPSSSETSGWLPAFEASDQARDAAEKETSLLLATKEAQLLHQIDAALTRSTTSRRPSVTARGVAPKFPSLESKHSRIRATASRASSRKKQVPSLRNAVPSNGRQVERKPKGNRCGATAAPLECTPTSIR